MSLIAEVSALGGAIVAGGMLLSAELGQNPVVVVAVIAGACSVVAATITAVVGPMLLQKGNQRAAQLETLIEGFDVLTATVHSNHIESLGEFRKIDVRVASLEAQSRGDRDRLSEVEHRLDAMQGDNR